MHTFYAILACPIQCDAMVVQHFLPNLLPTFQTEERSVKASVKKEVAQTTAKVARNVEVKLYLFSRFSFGSDNIPKNVFIN